MFFDRNLETGPGVRRSSQMRGWARLLAVALALGLNGARAEAQKTQAWRIGFLVPGARAAFESRVDAFREGLKELGYAEGRNVQIEYRYAERGFDQLSELASELVQLKVDIIVTAGTGTVAAKNTTGTIPIVFAAATDPVGTGLVQSLARPGGNITGVTNLSEDLDGKRLELLKDAVPNLSRVAHLWNTKSPKSQVQRAAQALGLKLQTVAVGTVDDFDGAFQTTLKERSQALIVSPSPFFITHDKRIADFANKNRIASIYHYSSIVDGGALMSYGLVMGFNFRRVAYFVDRIFKGARPADIPVEQPAKFELVVNLKTAKQLGLNILPSVLARADRVIK